MRMELIILKEELYKEKIANLRTLIGPPLTMLLISEGLLIIQQEIEAGILMPSLLEEKPLNKKRKYEQKLGQIKGNSSKEGESPQILVAKMELAMTKNVLISIEENGASQLDPVTLKDILQKLNHTTQLLENWITTTSNLSNRAEHKVVTGCEKANSTAQRKISDLKSQVQNLQDKSAAVDKQIWQIAAATQLQINKFQQKYNLLHS